MVDLKYTHTQDPTRVRRIVEWARKRGLLRKYAHDVHDVRCGSEKIHAVTVCLAKTHLKSFPKFVTFAFCGPGNSFDKVRGEEIAGGRARKFAEALERILAYRNEKMREAVVIFEEVAFADATASTRDLAGLSSLVFEKSVKESVPSQPGKLEEV